MDETARRRRRVSAYAPLLGGGGRITEQREASDELECPEGVRPRAAGAVFGSRMMEAERISMLRDAFSEVLGEQRADALLAAAEGVPYPGEGPGDVETDRERMVRMLSDAHLLDG